MNVILITGASSGLGREFARQMDACFPHMDEIWLIARREGPMRELAATLRHRARIFALDLTGEGQMERIEDALRKEKAVVRILVNAAGYGRMGAFADGSLEGQLGMIRLNCEALTSLTHRVLPFMRRGSRILQLASGAAFLPQSDFAVYAATKAYVLRFSRALGAELKPRGIFVTSVCPGPVDTPFFETAEQEGSAPGWKKRFLAQPKDVVRQALIDSSRRRPLSVYGVSMKSLGLLARLLPHGLFLWGMGRMKALETGFASRNLM